MEQKFKRGNLVRILVGHEVWSNKKGVTDILPNDVGRKAIVEYSYAEKFGGNNVNDYSLMWQDNGSSFSWKSTNELELIDEGGEYLFDEVKAKMDTKKIVTNHKIIS